MTYILKKQQDACDKNIMTCLVVGLFPSRN